MPWKHRAALALYGLVTLCLLGFALVYLGRSEFMPYHAAAVGMGWEALPQRIQWLIRALMTSLGSAWLALAITMGVLLAGPWREGKRWAVHLIPVLLLLAFGLSGYAAWNLEMLTGARTPWRWNAWGAGLALLAWVLSASRSPVPTRSLGGAGS